MRETSVQKHLSPGVFLTLIIMLYMFAPISTDMYLPALADMVSELDTTESMLNATLYCYMMFLGISMVIMGPLIDKYGRKGILLGCLAEYIVASFLAAMVSSVEQLIVLRILQAIGSGGVMTITTAFIKDSYSGPKMTFVLRLVAIIAVVGPVAAPIIGSLIIVNLGWRYTFYAPAVFALACLFISVFVTETLPEKERIVGGFGAMMHGMRTILRNRLFMGFMLMICMFNLPFMGYLSVSSYIYEGTFGFGAYMYSMMLVAALIGSVIISILVAKYTSRIVNRQMIPFYLVLGFAGTVILLTVAKLSPYLFLLAFILILGSSTTVRPWGMGVLMRSHDGDSGTLSSMINALFFAVGTVGMAMSTLPWPDYITGLGCLGALSCAMYLIMMVWVMRSDGSAIRELDGTAAGEDRR